MMHHLGQPHITLQKMKAIGQVQHTNRATNLCQNLSARKSRWPDTEIAEHAIKTLKRVSKEAKPFFLAVGFLKPHLPFIFPETFLNFYPKSDIRVPDNEFAPVNMPEVAWTDYGELRKYRDIKKHHFSGKINTTLPNDLVKELRRYYYAAVSYIDSLVGEVLKVSYK